MKINKKQQAKIIQKKVENLTKALNNLTLELRILERSIKA